MGPSTTPATPSSSRARPWVHVSVLALALVLTSSCSGRQSPSERQDAPIEFQSDRAYLRLPASLGGALLEAERTAPALLSCYESYVTPEAAAFTDVQLQLVFEGGAFRARVAQQSWPPAQSFTGCVDEVVMHWDVNPEVAGQGDILPIEFGQMPDEVPQGESSNP